MSELHDVAKQMVAAGKGILAIDESHGTCKKRFDTLGIECTPETRRQYRQLLMTAPGIEEAVAGMILFDETLRQKTDDGTPFPEALNKKGIMPGIKVDTGAHELALHPGEKVTEGLDGLRARLAEYKKLGAQFAKWRAVITIDDEKDLPSPACLEVNAHALARYAALCQEAGIVPMVEPEILWNGSHDIDSCNEVADIAWDMLFEQLDLQDVDLEGVILKTSMIMHGKDSGTKNTASEVAKHTLETFQEVVPDELAGIVFLSGGLAADQATEYLNQMNKTAKDLPWPISFSYGRAIQQPALEQWNGDSSSKNIAKAQAILVHRAKMNSLASKGEYTGE